MTEERISEPEDKPAESIQPKEEKQKQKHPKNPKQKTPELWRPVGSYQVAQIHVIGVPEGEEGDVGG